MDATNAAQQSNNPCPRFTALLTPPNATRLASVLCELTGVYEGWSAYQLAQADSAKTVDIAKLGVFCMIAVSYGAYLWYMAKREEQRIAQNQAFFNEMATEANARKNQ
jgi:hypothetical protein